MKNALLILACVAAITLGSCKKNSTPTTPVSEQQVLTDFANVLVNPNYVQINANAQILNTAVTTLVTTTTDANLAATQVAWRNTRASWESCEGFLFGPVEDFNYDPTMDSWPVDKVELDSLMASTNPLGVSDLTPLTYTLKGFHAIEYLIFGVGSTRKAADLTAREKVYLTSLSQSLLNTTAQLVSSWNPNVSGNYTLQVVNAGNGSTTFTTRKAVFLALVGSMADICNEVGSEKMQIPFAAKDSTQDESSFSHNSLNDFTNNITGIRNAYMCTFAGKSGQSLSSLVASQNASLDNTLQTQINTAIASFGGITTTFELAIYNQPSQIKAVQTNLATLKATLEGDLTTFINTNIKD